MFKVTIQNTANKWRIDEDSGFLRVTARLAKAGVMNYKRSELEQSGIEIPSHITADTIPVLLPLESINNPAFLNTIEGSAATLFHEWQDITSQEGVIGSFAGKAKINNQYLEGDFIIKDPAAIKHITERELVEISSAYTSGEFVFESGEFENISYLAVQRGLTYNHTAFLPEGFGRAGTDVKILNTKDEKLKTQKLRLSNMAITVEVDEASVDALEKLDAKFANMVDRQELDAIQQKLDASIAAHTLAKEENEQLKSPAALQNALSEAIAIREKADAILAGHGIKLENCASIGEALMTDVVRAVRAKNSLPPADEASEVTIKTMFEGYHEQLQFSPTGKKPPHVENASDKNKNKGKGKGKGGEFGGNSPFGAAKKQMNVLYGNKEKDDE